MLITLWKTRITRNDFLRIHLSYDKIVILSDFSIIYLTEKSYLLFVNKTKRIIQIVIFWLSIVSKKNSDLTFISFKVFCRIKKSGAIARSA